MPGITVDAGVVVIAPDTFGQKGTVLQQVGAEAAAEKLAEALRAALGEYRAPDKTFQAHVRRGARQGIFWETRVPVTDPMEKAARERGRRVAQPPKGSAPRLRQPRAGRKAGPRLFIPHSSHPSHGSPRSHRTTAMRVLVIEDEPELRRVLAQALREDGYAVDEAADGPDGLSRATAWDYDLVLLDLMLPGLNGLDLLQRCAARSRPRS